MATPAPKPIDSKNAATVSNAAKEKQEKKELTPEELSELLLADLKRNLSLVEKSVAQKDGRLQSRALRALNTLRKTLTTRILLKFLQQAIPFAQDKEVKETFLRYVSSVQQNEMDIVSSTPTETPASSSSSSSANSSSASPSLAPVASSSTTSTPPETKWKPRSLIPETESYIHLLIVVFLLDKRQLNEAISASTSLIERILFVNRRSLNATSALAFFYYARAYELSGRFEEIRGNLLAYHRTCTLRHNEDAQVTLINLLLRNYITYNLYEQADRLISKVVVKEETTSANQYARYLYYRGHVRSMQLDYTQAYTDLIGAVRKAPQNGALGFRTAATKLACIVQLLMGEIPERSIFRQQGLRKSLQPYYELTQSVRVGDLVIFTQVIQKYANIFKHDKTYTLITRLRHNVIKVGLRKINVSYSRISLQDICNKLHLENVEDAEYIVAKAIRDGVISAEINHEHAYVQSKESSDRYRTSEPQLFYHRRIVYCLNLHNDAVKAMRYPNELNKSDALTLETEKERREREEELAKLAEEEDGFD